MSSPIAINYPTSSSSSRLYVPVHRRAPSTSSSCASSPTHSSRSLSPMPHDRLPSLPIYTPSDLLLLASSPLSKLSPAEFRTLRAAAPEIVQSRKQRKSHEWHMRQSPFPSSPSHKRSQFSSRSHSNTSESEGEGQGWRK
ncbi:hypothetical protein DFH29DRAFT_999712 [Suillus ampliporus]|nr:hypothetical protein DFH29DRAFT_999712 [Suillus ampliporus]